MPEENRGPWSKKFENRCGIQSAFRRVTHQRPRRRRRRRVYFGPYRNNPDNNGMDRIVTIYAGQREICPVSVNLPSASKTFVFQALFNDIIIDPR